MRVLLPSLTMRETCCERADFQSVFTIIKIRIIKLLQLSARFSEIQLAKVDL